MSLSNHVPKLVVLRPSDKDRSRLLTIERCRSVFYRFLNDLLELGIAEGALIGKVIVASSSLK